MSVIMKKKKYSLPSPLISLTELYATQDMQQLY